MVNHLIGSTNGSATTYDLTYAEGSVLTSLSSSAVLGEQIYGPYGNQRYTQGTMGTDKGYTSQFQDAATGLEPDCTLWRRCAEPGGRLYWRARRL